jgi:hypothetical protein
MLMGSSRFNPEVPPKVGAQVRINAGQFEGYTGEVTKLDAQGRVVYFAITVFERLVELSLRYDTATETLGDGWHAFADPSRNRYTGNSHRESMEQAAF